MAGSHLEGNNIRSKLISLRDISNKKATVEKLEEEMLDLLEDSEALELMIEEHIEFKIERKQKKKKKSKNVLQKYVNEK